MSKPLSSLWRGFPAKIKYVLTVLTFLGISISVTLAGVLTPLTREDAQELNRELEEMQEYVSTVDIFSGTKLIFGNNFILCLFFFVPFAGPVFGLYVLYSTGVVIAAQSISLGVNPTLTFLLLFIFPFTWLEFLAYSAAFAQSARLSWRIIKRNCRRELVNTSVMISICAVTLLLAAVTEMAIIKGFT
ncbi:MAG: stage II sporulation protein M [Candidatus Bathyarchaeia archaeon]